jgi:cysteine-rich repeat protein
MNWNMLKTTSLTLLAALMVACGGANGDALEGEPGFVDEGGAGGDEGNGGAGADGGDGGAGGEPDDGEPIHPEPPFCGDGKVDEDEECDDGNVEDGDGCSSVCEDEPLVALATGDVSINLILDDLSSNTEPTVGDCEGAIELSLEEGVLLGDGQCDFVEFANFMTYSVDALVDDAGNVEGEIEVVLNNRPYLFALEGTLEDSSLELVFDGVNIVIGNIRGIWDGTISADFD